MLLNRTSRHLVVRIAAILFAVPPAAGLLLGAEPDMEVAPVIEEDWAAQEQLRGRSVDDADAVRDVAERCKVIIGDLSTGACPVDLTSESAELDTLLSDVNELTSLDKSKRRELYHRIRWLTRRVAMKNPLVISKPIVFLKRRRFTTQMLHEYIGYYYDYADIAGGGVCVLTRPGSSFEIRELTDGKLPRRNFTTLSLSYDAETAYFAFSPRSAVKPDYYSPERNGFHLYCVDVKSGQLKQLTKGQYDDFDPCPLPDSGMAFMSTRRGGFGRCHNEWEPLPAYTLHRMNTDGTNIQTLSFHETNEWHPSVLSDGRIVYTRWDYVDRSAANFHGLWTSNPDGTNPMVLFGNYTRRINACYQPHSVPGSSKIAFISGAHHAAVGGSLVLLEPDRVALDKATGEDDFASIEMLTPGICFPEASGWPDHFFHSPWPLSEDVFLVAVSMGPLPGMGPQVKNDTNTGLYGTYNKASRTAQRLGEAVGVPSLQ